MNELLRRIHYLLNRQRLDQELAEEMDAHRAAATEDSRPFGNSLRLREESRDAWGWTWLDRLAQDLRYAFRMLRKSPGFTLAAILLLAIGTGVNVAAFGFFNLMFFKPLPLRDADRLVRLEPRSPTGYATFLPYPEAAFLRDYSRTLSAVIASTGARLRIEGEEKPISARFVTANFFSELDGVPAAGRLLTPTIDGAADSQPVAVLSHAFWQRHYGSDPEVIGKTLSLNAKPVTIVGVATEDFSGLDLSTSDVWLAISQQPYVFAGSRLLIDFSHEDGVDAWARLKPGVTIQASEQELKGLVTQLWKQHPKDIWEKESIHADLASDVRLRQGRSKGSGTPPTYNKEVFPIVFLVSALALLILMVACGNLGSLLLARSVAREREIRIRISVGAGRGRLIRQLLTESVLLATVGSLAGLFMAFFALRAILVVSQAPAWLKATPDWRVISFSLGIGMVAALLFGLTPALQIARQRHRATFFRQIMIAGQVAASCVLLIIAGLLVRATDRALHADPGFDYQNVILVEPGLDAHGYEPAKARAYFDALQTKLRQIPGVETVALTSIPPLGGRVEDIGTEIAGRQISIHVTRISPEFLKAMGIRLQRGRNLERGDTRSLVISDSFARIGWPGKDALGGKFTSDGTDFTVVGIVRTAHLVERENPDPVEAYFPMEAGNLPGASLIVKTSGAAEPLLQTIHAAAKSVTPDVIPFSQLVKNSFREKNEAIEKTAMAVSLLGTVALFIACLGIVGMVAYAVSQRTKEIGLRMALGATRSHVLFVVLWQFGRTVVVGGVAGLAAAAALSQLLRQQLYGVNNLDPAAYAAALLVFAGVAAMAALWPASRALRIDPMRALRQD